MGKNLPTTRAVSYYLNDVFIRTEQMLPHKIEKVLVWFYLPQKPGEDLMPLEFEYRVFRMKGMPDAIQYHRTDDCFQVINGLVSMIHEEEKS